MMSTYQTDDNEERVDMHGGLRYVLDVLERCQGRLEVWPEVQGVLQVSCGLLEHVSTLLRYSK